MRAARVRTSGSPRRAPRARGGGVHRVRAACGAIAAAAARPGCTHDHATRACHLAAVHGGGESARDATPESRRPAVSTQTDDQSPESRKPSDAAPTDGDPAPSPHRRPTMWIVLCAVLALAVVGLGIWALTAQSDADDAQAKLGKATAAAAAGSGGPSQAATPTATAQPAQPAATATPDAATQQA